MSVEFTGERVIPGQVNVDLWNEHLSRYAFASRLARRKRVLDLGCGTGYGANELSRNASCVIGIDLHEEAIVYASRHSQGNSRFLQGDVRSLPFANGSFDLITCFEVIEHLEDWQTLLAEASRTLAPAGQCIVSTPNKDYYAQARGIHGPNPFHKHEFTLDEFRTALSVQFKHTLLFVQNHTGAIAFQPLVNSDRTTADLRLEERQAGATDANFFVAVCAHQPMMGSPAFLYVPATANVLREREEHIQRLEAELALKEQWLASAQKAHAALIEEHDHQSEELKKANAWALDLNKRIADAGEVITGLQGELSELHRSTTEVLAQRDETIASHEQAIRSYLGET
jgi:2-polyprenyl-3-methyl-5-hydroxy-6-metoxy-1,4-benzoquinol methylase